jgi:hypothetical protein
MPSRAAWSRRLPAWGGSAGTGLVSDIEAEFTPENRVNGWNVPCLLAARFRPDADRFEEGLGVALDFRGTDAGDVEGFLGVDRLVAGERLLLGNCFPGEGR